VVLERPGTGVGRAAAEAPPAGSAEPAPAAVAAAGPGRADQLMVALAQLEPRLGDLPANLEQHLATIREAVQHGADLVVFPELSLTGYFLMDLVPEVALRTDSVELRELAQACGSAAAVVGCVLESDDMRFYNAAVVLSGGEVRQVHRKVYLPTYGLFDEHRYLAAGDGFEAFTIRFAGRRRPWRFGVMLCEDMWHPSAAGLLARQAVDAFLCPSASPGRGVMRGMSLGTAQSYDVMTRTDAQLYTSYLVYCNRVGYEDGVNFWGGSRVAGPDGALLDAPAGADAVLLYHQLSRAALRRARIESPLLRDERHDVNDAENERIRRRGNG